MICVLGIDSGLKIRTAWSKVQTIHGFRNHDATSVCFSKILTNTPHQVVQTFGGLHVMHAVLDNIILPLSLKLI